MADAEKRTPVCTHCGGNGFSGGVRPSEPELCDACEVCGGSGHFRRGFTHAKVLDTRWGPGLAFVDMDDENDRNVLTLQLWAPLCEDGSDACVRLRMGLPGSASIEAHEIFDQANRDALATMTAEQFEAGLDKAGVGAALDEAFAKQEAE